MEESEKRKERLRAMRAEADQADNSSNLATLEMPCSLSNPLAETPLQEEQRSNNARFDFYTDPMSAFSSNKNRNDTSKDHMPSKPMMGFPSPRPGPRIAEPSPRAHQYQGNYAPPNQQMYQPRGFGHNPIPYRGPIPYNAYQGNQNYPMRPGVATSYNYNSPSLPTPGFGPTGSPYHGGQGRGQWVDNGPSHGPGRGGGPSPNWRRGGGGGRYHGGGPRPVFGGHSSGAERFYNKFMIEDPWKFLEPVIWTEVKATPSGLRFPSSIGAKKARVSDGANKSDSQPSLAEYLAASFNEAVDDSPNG